MTHNHPDLPPGPDRHGDFGAADTWPFLVDTIVNLLEGERDDSETKDSMTIILKGTSSRVGWLDKVDHSTVDALDGIEDGQGNTDCLLTVSRRTRT